MANKIIREKIITGFKSIAKHGKHFDLVNVDEQQITNELGKMIRFARSDINKMNSA